MEDYLNKKQIDYIFFHLNHHFNIHDFKESIELVREQKKLDKGKIYFYLSKKKLDPKKISKVKNIDVLFPLETNTDTHYSIKEKSLIFNYDILKSVFYLLSRFDEFSNEQYDSLGRFPYKKSIQHKLGIIHKPLVNYYIEIIKEAFSEFSKINNLRFEEKKIFENFGFLLTHDVDRIKYYKFDKFILLIQQFIGLKKSQVSKSTIGKRIFDFISHALLLKKSDPYWNFDYLNSIEKKHNFSSVYFFLHKDVKYADSYYRFKEKKIRILVELLQKKGNEIGIHGSVRSDKNIDILKFHIEELEKITHQKIIGIRQHRLKFNVKTTPNIHNNLNLKYDSTLAYAENEGFRNSYCLPYKLFDHKNNRMLKVWEFPLTVMDSTLFDYRKLDFGQAKLNIDKLIEEIKKFNGLFVLLWHNSYFDEINKPGITNFYESILQSLSQNNPDKLSTNEILEKLNSISE